MKRKLDKPSAIVTPKVARTIAQENRMTNLVLEREAARVAAEENDEELPANVEPEDDLGIEGLTIVMHMRNKDDLVINTDLTRLME